MQEDLGIVLRSQPFKERDRLVTFLTENHGKVTGIAKGAIHSKRFGGSLDLFTCSHFRFTESHGSDLVRIDEANVRRDFLNIRKDLENISAAGYFTDLCLRLTEERQSIRELFLLLAHYFYLLEERKASLEIVRSFEIKLLDRLGYSPNLDQCVSCNAALEDQCALAIERGGFLCNSCAPASQRRLREGTLFWFRAARDNLIQNTPFLHFPVDVLNEGAQILQGFLRYHGPGMSQHNFQSHALLESLLLARDEAKIQSTAPAKSSAT